AVGENPLGQGEKGALSSYWEGRDAQADCLLPESTSGAGSAWRREISRVCGDYAARSICAGSERQALSASPRPTVMLRSPAAISIVGPPTSPITVAPSASSAVGSPLTRKPP